MPTPIFHDRRQSVEGVRSFSQSASKPARFVELMQHYAYHNYRSSGPCLHGVTPITKEDMYLVHSKGYIDELFALATPNGFGNYDPRIPESCLWTVGSLLSAARWSMANQHTPACSPVSGFHHASHKEAAGFCSVNGIMIVAAKLLAENPDLKVAILDLDYHLPDGTLDILHRFPVLEKQILHISNGEHWLELSDTRPWFAWLQKSIERINAFKPDLVIYQAGADMHADDLLDGFLSTQELVLRDRMVFREIKAPVVFDLAGGYQDNPSGDPFLDPVLAIHRNTLRESDLSIPVRKQKLKEKSNGNP